MELRLANGDRVCIIGGGPAGCFAALHLLKLSREQGLQLEVLIFEPRDFSHQGPSGCNGCAGVLSSRLVKGLDQLEISLPAEVVQAELHTYAAHLNGDIVKINQPDPRRRIISVYRGGGPRLLLNAPIASFDGYLLSLACSRGARHIPSFVRLVTCAERPVVFTTHEHFTADLLILATGVNSSTPLAPDFGYLPPKTEAMVQDEFLRPSSWPRDQVSAFFQQPAGLVFGALVPKGRYLNISLLGSGLDRNTISRFIEAHNLNPEDGGDFKSLCGCMPRIAVSAAQKGFGNRWVAVGDAVVTRLYKDGIGSAYLTAQAAVQAALAHGITKDAFQKEYAPLISRISMDNVFGRLLFRAWALTIKTPPLLKIWKNAVKRECGCPPDQRIHIRILWGMCTGDELYRDMFWLFLNRSALRGLWNGLRMTYKEAG